MPLTEFQREICRFLAANRIASGESYVAGGAALAEVLGTSRLSRDVDVFHDTSEALQRSWDHDRELLETRGFTVIPARERRSFVEAEIRRDGDSAILEWAEDSAFRYFPLVEHPVLGLTLHPFDLATNKVLALVGRLEVRDWVDMLTCVEQIQPLGYLAWAACGKDPGFSPPTLLGYAARAHYSTEEVATLSFSGPPPDAGELSRRWHAALAEAREVVALLPAEEVGRCVLTREGQLFRGSPDELREGLARDQLVYHVGSIRGALPRVIR